jgi:DNA polymerase I-like protein with 3'-5' exonuclease and polymerase domains
VTEKRAKEILKGIDVALPKYKETQQGAISFWKQHGYVETKDGRRLYPRKPSEVLSYYLLATESGVMKRASNITSAKIKEYGVSAWMVVYQHDEYGYLCEEKYVDWLKQVMIDSITQASNEMQQNYCPQVGDASHGDSWLDTH